MSTYTPISHQTLSTAAATVIFDGIPQIYTDLILVISGRTTLAGQNQEDGLMRLNGDTNSNYSNTSIYGNGSTAGSDRFSSQTSARFAYWFPAANAASGIFSATTVHIMNYGNTTTNKTILARQSNQSNVAGLPGANVSLWRSTTAINRIEIYPAAGGSWASGSTFTLYGIGEGSPKAFGGDVVVQSGGYWYHAFLTSGQFAPVVPVTADILVVAGGGGADGNTRSGGGGAGGLLGFNTQALGAQNYTITVGAGGAAGGGFGAPDPTNGSDSRFGTFDPALGGGAGGLYLDPASNGSAGGSGGGGTAGANNGQGLGGAGQSGQGFAGGNSINRTGGAAGGWTAGGGGGGAGAAGQNATGNGASNTTNTPGNGGNGSSAYSTWGAATNTGHNVSGTYWFAGGGASAGINSGGSNLFSTAGNGNGGNNTTAPQANTGGGGSAGTASQGASGVVIVRYAV